MVAAIFTEPRIAFGELASREGVHVSTVWRWTLHGVRGVRLESLNVGGKRMTTQPAYERFLMKLNAAADSPTLATIAEGATT